MKNITLYAFVIILISACNQPTGLTVDTSKPTELATGLDSVSYLLGTNVATDLTQNGGMKEIDNKSFLTGMQRVFEGKDVEINEADARAFMQSYFTRMKEEKSSVNMEEGAAYLEENKAKEGVQVTESGLQYKVITEGTGAIPTKEDMVRVHYIGKLVDGTIFDSAVERGEPLEFATTGVIPGWTEALTMMPVGSKWELVIPSNLAYGESGTGPIPGNSTLLFEVELLDIIKQEETPANQ